MSTVFVSLFFHDPDSPRQVALIEMDSAEAQKSELGRALLGKLMNEEVSTETFAGCVRAGSGGAIHNAASNDEVVHAYLYDVAQSEAGQAKVKEEARTLLRAGQVTVDHADLLDRYNPSWLIIEMALALKHLSSDSFEGLDG